MLYVSMLSAAELQSVRVLANATHDGRRIRRTVDGIVGDSE